MKYFLLSSVVRLTLIDTNILSSVVSKCCYEPSIQEMDSQIATWLKWKDLCCWFLFVCFTKWNRNKDHLLKSTPLYSWLFGWYVWHSWLSDTVILSLQKNNSIPNRTYGFHLWKNGFKYHLTSYYLMSAWVQSKQSLLFQKYFWVWK